jgi:hypothetical protein
MDAITVIIGIVAVAALVFGLMAYFQKGKKEEVEQAASVAPQAAAEPKKDDLGEIGRVNAAIGLALSLYMDDVHDYENMILTMQQVARPYSPWSSKIYGLTQIPTVIKTRK